MWHPSRLSVSSQSADLSPSCPLRTRANSVQWPQLSARHGASASGGGGGGHGMGNRTRRSGSAVVLQVHSAHSAHAAQLYSTPLPSPFTPLTPLHVTRFPRDQCK